MSNENNSHRFAFFCKAPDIGELKAGKLTHPFEVDVVQVAELSAEEFITFGGDLLADYDFIADCKDIICFDQGKIHCLLVKSNESEDGVLVVSEGYMYARYAAYVDDCAKLNLDDVPVIRADLCPPLRPHRGFER